MAVDIFEPGDRVELVRHYSFWGDPPPQATVVSATNRRIRCKMDRSGKLIRFSPEDLRHVEELPSRQPAPSAEKPRGLRSRVSGV